MPNGLSGMDVMSYSPFCTILSIVLTDGCGDSSLKTPRSSTPRIYFLGVPKLPQNTTISTMISNESTLIQKVNMGSNRGAGIVMWNNNSGGEGVFVFTYFPSGAIAKLLIKRVSSDNAIPLFYYDGSMTIAIKARELWGSWTIISSNNNLPPKGTVDSELTGFTQVTIQQ